MRFYLSPFYNIWCTMADSLRVGENSGFGWRGYATITCIVLIMILCIIPIFTFRNNLKISLFLIGIIIVLFSANICFVCCKELGSECFILLGFIVLEDVLTIIFCILTRRFKPAVSIVLLYLSMAFMTTGWVLLALGRKQGILIYLVAGFWNTSLVLAALDFASSLK
uniref:Uncharacterized protein n=1 Tax=Trichobilharzia regenti TaxID=157069 RepID=A0AA85J9B8_TRIRE|nr:unnamed protein product [Trichobilharzia regenti]